MVKPNLSVFSCCSEWFHWFCLKIQLEEDFRWCDRRGSIWQGGKAKEPSELNLFSSKTKLEQHPLWLKQGSYN